MWTQHQYEINLSIYGWSHKYGCCVDVIWCGCWCWYSDWLTGETRPQSSGPGPHSVAAYMISCNKVTVFFVCLVSSFKEWNVYPSALSGLLKQLLFLLDPTWYLYLGLKIFSIFVWWNLPQGSRLCCPVVQWPCCEGEGKTFLYKGLLTCWTCMETAWSKASPWPRWAEWSVEFVCYLFDIFLLIREARIECLLYKEESVWIFHVRWVFTLYKMFVVWKTDKTFFQAVVLRSMWICEH